jgi:hypothetical protein
MDKEPKSELHPKFFPMKTGYPRNPPSPPFFKGGLGGDFRGSLPEEKLLFKI